ncbi:endonuclease/exonuclease/phosphatase family protein [Christiangramia fulva]|uniref:endonuclease/exonuclease/phosphatase family protein n=1 Tax=Christiangramia fulva TaxID=2126553 RepID=UPI001D05670D|nr:endonuclease/exonuclease/phosphatase family protein [Christiangramia fulva]
MLSFIILLAGYTYVNRFIEIGEKDTSEKSDFSIMSYNVRMFNEYGWSPRKDIPQLITDFVKEKNPDVICMQEFYIGATHFSKLYPYHYIKIKEKNSEFGTAIFSKFPILKKHSLYFPQDGNNNAVYVDILVNKKDTVRIFNVHFQSLNIKPGIEDIQKEDSQKLLGRIGYGFSLQQDQVEMLLPVVQNTPYRKMIVGDFNNTAFSYLYNLLKTEADLNDAFMQKGNGFGKSFDLNYFPLRIDFMLLGQKLKATEFHRYEINYSDHYPILSKIKL